VAAGTLLGMVVAWVLWTGALQRLL
ncbi:MAG: hypothetical protein RL334_287, partial [Chloroflexota bacterium]